MTGRSLGHARSVAIPNDFVQQFTGVPNSEKVLPPNTRGILLGTAGTLNVTMENGSARLLVPFQAGINPGRFASIQTGGTGSNVWAVV
jgi:hypothetical protein